MRVLIIGGTRFIGPRVVRRLIERGDEVGVFYRGEHEAALPAGVHRFKDSRAGIPVIEIPDELRTFGPELVLHMVAMGESDGAAGRKAFTGTARRIVMLSSGDVYRAYGVFKGSEEGPPEPGLIRENSPLRTRLYPYRTDQTPRDSLEYFYDKIIAEHELSTDSRLPATILRLPKVYGPDGNADLATVYGFRNHPRWRWTHGYVENVAQAIVSAIHDERALGRTYNVGEAVTPTVAERLAYLPPRSDVPLHDQKGNFEQDIAYDTSLIRNELNYKEGMAEREAMMAVAGARPA